MGDRRSAAASRRPTELTCSTETELAAMDNLTDIPTQVSQWWLEEKSYSCQWPEESEHAETDDGA
jgi:hypothetical protein